MTAHELSDGLTRRARDERSRRSGVSARSLFQQPAPWLLDTERSTSACVQVDGPFSPLVVTETAPPAVSGTQRWAGRRFFHLRAPWLLDSQRSTDARVQVDGPCSPLVVKVGEDKPLSMPVDAGWALWRCLGEALASTGEPPLWALGEVQVSVPERRRRWPLRARREVPVTTTSAGGGRG